MMNDLIYRVYHVHQKKCPLVEKLPSNSSKMQKLGVFWKIEDICYNMATEILKIDEEMTEKMKPQVANPPPKMGRILCSQYTFINPHSYSLGH